MAYTASTDYTGQANTATPGSTTNKPATGRQKYGIDVITHRMSDADAAYYQRHGHDPVNVTADLGAVLQAIYKMPAPEVKSLQQRLVAAGLLSAKAYTPGIPDEYTVSAYEKLLLRAGYGEITPDEALNAAIAAGPPSLDAAQRAPFSPQVTSAEDIKTYINEQVPQIIGHKLTDAQTSQLAALYQQMQIRAQRQTYDTGESGGTATSVEGLDTFVKEQARRIDPVGAGVQDRMTVAANFLSAINAGSPPTQEF